jgi:hypothetical protein
MESLVTLRTGEMPVEKNVYIGYTRIRGVGHHANCSQELHVKTQVRAHTVSQNDIILDWLSTYHKTEYQSTDTQ